MDVDTSSPKAFVISLVSLGAAWLAGRAWTWLKGRQDDTDKQRVETIERWARKAATTILPLLAMVPPEFTGYIERKLREELQSVLKRVGLTMTDDEWAHALEVAHEFLITLSLQQMSLGAQKVAKELAKVEDPPNAPP